MYSLYYIFTRQHLYDYKIQACLGTAAVSFPQAQIRLLCTELDIGGEVPGTQIVLRASDRVVLEPCSQPMLKETSKKQQQSFHHFFFLLSIRSSCRCCLSWPVDHQLSYILYSHFRNMPNSTNYSNTTVHSMIIHHIYRGK